MSLSNIAYYRDRVAVEKALALAASSLEVAAVHEDLARHYQELIDRAETGPTPKIISSE